MTQRLTQQAAILAALASGATVVSASERLARAVQLAYAEDRQAAGRRAWRRPEVLPWQAFLEELWVRSRASGAGAAHARLLTARQAEALWEEIVRDSHAAHGLLQPRAAAAAARDAWALCHAYRLDPAGFSDCGNADAEEFAGWAEQYRVCCRRGAWLDGARLADELAPRLAAHRDLLPTQVTFAGFHVWTPQQQAFLDALRAAGCVAERLETESAGPSAAHRLACTDGDDELRSAAHWAAALLEADPAARIGIVVHDLGACRERLARALDDAFCPSARLGDNVERPYDVSLGHRLAETPVVHDALLLLSLLAHPAVEFDLAAQCLRSPFLRAAGSERAPRLRFEAALRQGSARLSLRRLLAAARVPADLPELVEVLAAATKWREAAARHQLPSAWAHGFAVALRAFGWPGERSLESGEHQAVEAFRAILGELARFDLLGRKIEAQAAWSRLGELAADAVFQPAAADAPVQVLGVFEATDLHFDHLWIAGWTDDVWPASPRPDALIPVRLQRMHDLPHASARRELEFATQLTARLLAAAPDIVVSHPRHDADRELRMSPLIAGLPEIERARLARRELEPYARLLRSAAPALEALDDQRAPPVALAKVHGGTAVLKSQAACPFQAFARYRLEARALAVPEPGLDAKQRGILLHDLMYRVFAALTDQAAIAGQSETALAAIIATCVAEALDKAQHEQAGTFTPHFVQLERERLTALIVAWLEVERARAPFRVEQLEFDAEVRIGRLEFKTRIDRLDRLQTGGFAIVDYKTGDAKPSAWEGARPDEPQLPCYAVTAGEDIAALLFAVLRPGVNMYRGYARDAGTVPGVPALGELRHPPDDCADWPALLTHWREVLTALADNFAAGHAEVAPKDRNRTCRVCDLAPLCRIDEIEALGDPPDD